MTAAMPHGVVGGTTTLVIAGGRNACGLRRRETFRRS